MISMYYLKIAFIASILFTCCNGNNAKVNDGFRPIQKNAMLRSYHKNTPLKTYSRQNSLNKINVNEMYKIIDDRNRILLDTEDVKDGFEEATEKAKGVVSLKNTHSIIS